MHLKEEIAKRPPQTKKKVFFYQNNVPCYKSIATMEKLHELHFELLLHPPYSPDLTPATTGCLQTSKECSRERDEDVISETEAYFETKDKSFFKKRMELLEKRCIILEGDYDDK